MTLSFANTEIAFRSKPDRALRRAFWLFRLMGYPSLVNLGTIAAQWALDWRIPIEPLLRATIFQQFCGGETIQECQDTIAELAKFRIGTILDYSVEGLQSESGQDATLTELLKTIDLAKGNPDIPFCVFKFSGLARASLLEKKDGGTALSPEETAEWERAKARLVRLCERAHQNNVRLFIDAEESWFQRTIDELATEMMARFNTKRAVVYNTLQMYRSDRLEFLRESHADAIRRRYHLGLKLVRGAYMEKERERAAARGLPSPILPDKESTDRSYDAALRYCLERIDRISLCAGTHNEASAKLLTELMVEQRLERRDPRVWFSQLLGMSDHLSFNLADEGYNVTKYVPYGPVRAVFPYLVRRAEENTAIQGQTGRELSLITAELRRRSQGPRLAPAPKSAN